VTSPRHCLASSPTYNAKKARGVCARNSVRSSEEMLSIEVTVGENVSAVQQSGVDMPWYARITIYHSYVQRHIGALTFSPSPLKKLAINHRMHTPSLTRMESRSSSRQVAHQHPYRRRRRTTLRLGSSQHNGSPCNARLGTSPASEAALYLGFFTFIHKVL
jgi:hypothetical protein